MEPRKISDIIAENITTFMGSIAFLGILSMIMGFWVVYNTIAKKAFDPYPFLFLSTFINCFSMFTAPLLLIAGNLAAKRDEITINKLVEITEKIEGEEELEKVKLEKLEQIEEMNIAHTSVILEILQDIQKDIKKGA